MFALKRVIEGDRWCRILSKTNNRSLIDELTKNEGIFSFYRAYASLIQSQNIGTYWSSCSNEEDSLKNTTLLARPRSITTQSSNNILLSQQPGRGFSYHNSRNKFHFISLLDESRALMTTSTPSSTSSSSSQPSSSQSSEESTRKKTSDYSTPAKIPTPKSSPTLSTSSNPLASIDSKVVLKGIVEVTWSATKTVSKFIIRSPGNIIFFITHQKERKEKITGIKEAVKKEIDHYWVGSKVSLNKRRQLNI